MSSEARFGGVAPPFREMAPTEVEMRYDKMST